MGAYAWYLAAAFLTGYLMFGVVLFARDAKKAPEVPPAEERPYIPEPSQDALAEAVRIEKRLREEYLQKMYAERRRQAKVQAAIDALVREVEHG
jgi:hypothetical protein